MSKKVSYDSEKKINETKQSINRILEENWGNGIYVFDFGHYYYDKTLNIDEENNHYYYKTVIKGSKRYIETLYPNGNDKKTDYTYFDRSIKEVCNISDEVNENNEEDDTYAQKVKEIVSKKLFKTSDWVHDLQNNKIGGCLFVSSIVAGNHQSAVWVVLKKPIEGFIKGKTYCFMSCERCPEKEGRRERDNDCPKGLVSLRDKRINNIFSIIDDLLINEIFYYLPDFVREIAHKYFPDITTFDEEISSIDKIFSVISKLANNSTKNERT